MNTAEKTEPSEIIAQPEAEQCQTRRYHCKNCDRAMLAGCPPCSLDHTNSRDRSDTCSTLSTSISASSISWSETTNSLDSMPRDLSVDILEPLSRPSFGSWGNEVDSPGRSQVVCNQAVEWGSWESQEVMSRLNTCACGEPGCTCRCSESEGPSPRDLNFFPLDVVTSHLAPHPMISHSLVASPQDFRQLAGVPDLPAEDPLFCRCVWSCAWLRSS